jgi:hypothetical protein
METTRRSFLQLFGLGTAVVAAGVVVPEIFMPEEKVVRTYFDMGRNHDKQILTGLYPIEGQPGLFRDAATGQVVNIREFRESDKYDTIVVAGRALQPRERMASNVASGVSYQRRQPLPTY